jgi:ABC-type glycerol-3-phosphate transport system substrate-binding protein
MNKKIIIALLIATVLLAFGCTNNNSTPTSEDKSNVVLNEIDSTWIDDNGLSMDDIIANESEAVAGETGTQIIDENQDITIGDMI